MPDRASMSSLGNFAGQEFCDLISIEIGFDRHGIVRGVDADRSRIVLDELFRKRRKGLLHAVVDRHYIADCAGLRSNLEGSRMTVGVRGEVKYDPRAAFADAI